MAALDEEADLGGHDDSEEEFVELSEGADDDAFSQGLRGGSSLGPPSPPPPLGGGRGRGRGGGRGGGRGRGGPSGPGATRNRRARASTPASTPDAILKELLKDVPGWSPENQGEDKTPLPPCWALDPESAGGDWSEYTIGEEGDECLFHRGKAPKWVRFEQIHIMLEYISKDAEFIGDWVTLDDPVRHKHQVATAKLLGMLTMGTSKGIVTGTPAFLERLGHGPEREAAHEKLKKNGMPGEYTFCVDPSKPHLEGLQFTWIFEWSYAPDGETRIGFWLTKAIADPTHSSDEQWQTVMEENAAVWRNGQTSGTEEHKRNPKMQAANKLHRTQVDATNLEHTVGNMYKTITNVENLGHIYHVYGGKSGSDPGWPLYPKPGMDLPEGHQVGALRKHRRWGGESALGPSVALNPFRQVPASRDKEANEHHYVGNDDEDYVNVRMSGLSLGGKRVMCREDQRYWKDYFNDNGEFDPPEFSQKKKAVWVCTKGALLNIFRARFPTDVAEISVPGDSLLKMLFELDHEKPGNSISLAVERSGGALKTFEQLRAPTVAHYTHQVLRRQSTAAKNLESALTMLTPDTLDMTSAEMARLDLRSYDQNDGLNRDANFVLEPRQVLKDLSIEIRRANDVAVEWNDRETARINDMPGMDDDDLKDAEKADDKRRVAFASGVDECIKMGLRSFEHAFACKRTRALIPPGWVDIIGKGLQESLQEAVSLSAKHAAMYGFEARRVKTTNVNASPMCANLAFLYHRSLTSRDTTPMGSWRTFLFTVFSRCASISGPDIRLMLELWTHAFEAFQEVSFFFLM